MSARRPKREAKPAQPLRAEIPAEMRMRIEAQRQQLFRASAVVDMCRYACASNYEGFDPEQLAVALWVVYHLIDHVAGSLEGFAEKSEAVKASNRTVYG